MFPTTERARRCVNIKRVNIYFQLGELRAEQL